MSRTRPEFDHERSQVCPFFSGLGIDIYPTSARNHVIGIRKGTPDLICFWERLGFQFYFETKVEGRRQTREQHDFELNCIATNVPYVLGGIDEAMDFVVFLEIAERAGPTIRVKPRDKWPIKDAFADIGNEWARSNYRNENFLRFGYRKAA